MKIFAVKILDINEEIFDKLCVMINSNEKDKIDKLFNKKDKIRTLIGRILIRNIIFKELNIKKNRIEFEKNKYGKPYLKNYPKFNFNISHSGEYVVCAIDSQPVGIDIEEVKCICFEEIAEKFFAKIEFEYIKKNDMESKISKFYMLWTLKESYLKNCGKGLTIPLKSFSFEIDKSKNINFAMAKTNNMYNFKTFDFDVKYKIAICSLNNNISDDIIIINQSSLIYDFCNEN